MELRGWDSRVSDPEVQAPPPAPSPPHPCPRPDLGTPGAAKACCGYCRGSPYSPSPSWAGDLDLTFPHRRPGREAGNFSLTSHLPS